MVRVERSLGAIVVALLVVFAGCSVLSPGATPTNSPGTGDSGTSSPTTSGPNAESTRTDAGPTPTGTQSTPSTTPAVPTPGADESVVVTVVGVLDGDTIRVEFDNGTTETAEMLGVDAPETGGDADPTKYDGVPDTPAGADCLEEWGGKADSFLRQQIRGEAIRISFDDDAGRRDASGHLLVYAFQGRTLVNRQLLAEGYGGVTDSGFARRATFGAAMRDARSASRGLWTCSDIRTATPTPTPTSTPTATPESPTGIRVVEIDADPPGPDREDLQNETIVLKNTGQTPLDLSGWKVRDEDGNTYTFPEGVTLDPGQTLTLHSSRGAQTETDRYWWADGPIWDNDADTVRIYDDRGQKVYERSYSR